PYLAAACEDNSLRVFALEADGKFGELTYKLYDALAFAKSELARPEAARREAALKALAASADTTAIDLIAEQMKQDADYNLRLMAAKLLCDIDHPRAANRLLTRGLRRSDEKVRVAAFEGLRRKLGRQDQSPLAAALATD